MNAIRRENPALWSEIREFAAQRESLSKPADDGVRALKYRDPDPPAGKKGNFDALKSGFLEGGNA
jgi:hypothetical protein